MDPSPFHERDLDDDAEEKLLTTAKSCNWKPEMFELFMALTLIGCCICASSSLHDAQ